MPGKSVPPVLQADPYGDEAPAECLRGLRPIRPTMGRAAYADPLADKRKSKTGACRKWKPKAGTC
jgi:hypothetical protein